MTRFVQRCALMKATQRVWALRGGQPDDLAASEVGCGRTARVASLGIVLCETLKNLAGANSWHEVNTVDGQAGKCKHDAQSFSEKKKMALSKGEKLQKISNMVFRDSARGVG
jgi:hypothetical protein